MVKKFEDYVTSYVATKTMNVKKYNALKIPITLVCSLEGIQHE